MTKLEEIISCIKGNSVYVQMHNFPDPDAIASAYGMKYLLRAEGIDAQIVYKGSIENTVTAKMVKLLNIDILEVKVHRNWIVTEKLLLLMHRMAMPT